MSPKKPKNRVPDLSQMISFTELYNEEKKKREKIENELKKLQLKFAKLQEKQFLLINRLNSQPVKRAQKSIGVQVKIRPQTNHSKASQTISTNETATTQTNMVCVVSIGTQSDSFDRKMDASTQTTIAATSFDGQSQTNNKNAYPKIGIFKCENCEYSTNHGGHFGVHKAEGCKNAAAEKDVNCPICCQCFTYNNLRSHIRQYTIDSTKAKNGHQNYTPANHKELLERIKKERKEAKL